MSNSNVSTDIIFHNHKIEEINSLGKTNQIELANEIIKAGSFD